MKLPTAPTFVHKTCMNHPHLHMQKKRNTEKTSLREEKRTDNFILPSLIFFFLKNEHLLNKRHRLN